MDFGDLNAKDKSLYGNYNHTADGKVKKQADKGENTRAKLGQRTLVFHWLINSYLQYGSVENLSPLNRRKFICSLNRIPAAALCSRRVFVFRERGWLRKLW